jgi:hypothetical protein
MVLANIGGKSLTDPHFAPIWQEIDRRGLPVLVHPTAPPGTPDLDMRVYNLIASVGFMFDTSLSVQMKTWMSWHMTFSERYISYPPPGLKGNDSLLSTGLRVTWGKPKL